MEASRERAEAPQSRSWARRNLAWALFLLMLAVVPRLRDVRRTLAVALIVGVMFFALYVCVGQFQVRLDYAALPPLVTVLGVVATGLAGRLPTTWRRLFGGACGAVALVAFVPAVAEGPHAMGQWFD
jgi:lipopolysaccharide export LptBFGC system permease protein LptF